MQIHGYASREQIVSRYSQLLEILIELQFSQLNHLYSIQVYAHLRQNAIKSFSDVGSKYLYRYEPYADIYGITYRLVVRYLSYCSFMTHIMKNFKMKIVGIFHINTLYKTTPRSLILF